MGATSVLTLVPTSSLSFFLRKTADLAAALRAGMSSSRPHACYDVAASVRAPSGE
jgi:hypothetical protein